jgi:ATP-binding protein involved in chromosome partitioning
MSSLHLAASDVRALCEGLSDPELGRSLKDLRMVQEADVAPDGAVRVVFDLPTPAYPAPERIGAALAMALRDRGAGDVPLDVRYVSNVRGLETGGTLGLRVKNVISVGSGKGGVGKSTVAAGIAYGLRSFGARVGLMDADVYGPSIPHMVGLHGRPSAVELKNAQGETVTRIDPLESHGVKCMSMGFFVEADQAVVWRGPLLHRAITQFLKDTQWGELDYLIIDLPPGTGDVSLTLSQLLGLAGAVVVCTPQQVALLDAVKAVSMFRQVKIPVLGMVENMTGEVFGRGGARKKAGELGIPCLGEIPIEARVRIDGDEGRIWSLFDADSPVRDAFLTVARNVAMNIARNLLETPRMPTLEIL